MLITVQCITHFRDWCHRGLVDSTEGERGNMSEKDRRPHTNIEIDGSNSYQRHAFWVGVVAVVVLLGLLWWILGPILWPQRVWIALILLLVGLVGLGAEIYHRYKMQYFHRVSASRKADVYHESEHGAIINHHGDLFHASHVAVKSEDVLEDAAIAEPEPVPTTFRELRAQGYLAPGSDMVIGFSADGKPIGMTELRTLGIAGISNSGKTNTTMVAIMSAIAKQNGHIKLIVTDPHMLVDGDQSLWYSLQPLSPFLLTLQDIRATVPKEDEDYHRLLDRMESNGGLRNPNMGELDLVDWMEVVAMEQSRRKELGKKGDVWLVVIDEFASVMQSQAAAPVGTALERMSQQARKMNIFAILVSQEWLATRVGGTELRHALQAVIVHNTPESVAELIVPKQYAAIAPALAQGYALFSSHGTVAQGHIVRADVQDAHWVVETFLHSQYAASMQLVQRQQPDFTAVVQPWSSQGAPKQEQPQPYTQKLEGLRNDISAEEVEKIRHALLAGLGEIDAAKLVFGVKSGPDLALAKIKVHDVNLHFLGRGL